MLIAFSLYRFGVFNDHGTGSWDFYYKQQFRFISVIKFQSLELYLGGNYSSHDISDQYNYFYSDFICHQHIFGRKVLLVV